MTDLSALSEPFDPAQLRRHEAKGLTYVPISEVIARLNRVLGPGSWSYRVNRTWEAGEVTTETGVYPAWVMAHVTLTAHPTHDGVGCTLDGVGGQQVKFLRNGTGPVDLGDEVKGAVSDALKKAAQHLGVGLELARKEEALAFEAASVPPAGWETRDAHDARRAELAVRAKALPPALGDGLKGWWKAQGLAWPLTPEQADAYAAKIAGYEAQATSPATEVPPRSDVGAAGGGAHLVADLEAVLDRMDRTQLKAIRAWAVAHHLPITEAGRPDLAALPAERLEALYEQVAAAA